MNTRQIRLLNYLYASKQFVTSQTLSDFLNVSDRTIKSDISFINGSLPNDLKIKSKKGKGYIFNIIGDHRIDAFVRTLEAHATKNLTIFSDEDRLLSLIHRLYLENDYIHINKLADEFYLSRSAILSLLSNISKAGKMNQVQLESTKIHGIRLRATEFKMRGFISSVYEIVKQKTSYSTTQDNISFFDIEKYNVIRKILVLALKRNEYNIYDFRISKITCYIYTALERIHNHFIIDNKITDDNKLSPCEIQIAKEIFENLGIPDSQLLENEYQALGIYLLWSREFLPNELDNIQYKYYSEKINYVTEICCDNNRFLNIALSDQNTKLKFHSLLLHIIITINLPKIQNNIVNHHNYPQSDRSPLGDGIATNIIYTIENYFHTKLETSYMKIISQLFFTNLLLSPDTLDIKVLVSSIYGANFTSVFSQRVTRLGSGYFSKIDTCNSYELRYMDLSDYNAIILYHILKIDAPESTMVKYINTRISDLIVYQAINEIYVQSILKLFLEKISKPIIVKKAIESNEQLVEFLEEYFETKNELSVQGRPVFHLNHIFNKTLFVFLDNGLTPKKNQLHIIRFSNKKLEYNEAFCLSFDFRNEVSNLRLVHTITNLYILNPEVFDPLF